MDYNNIEAAVVQADETLYLAKQKGNNRVAVN
jgi:PleD family two-component response regulator